MWTTLVPVHHKNKFKKKKRKWWVFRLIWKILEKLLGHCEARAKVAVHHFLWFFVCLLLQVELQRKFLPCWRTLGAVPGLGNSVGATTGARGRCWCTEITFENYFLKIMWKATRVAFSIPLFEYSCWPWLWENNYSWLRSGEIFFVPKANVYRFILFGKIKRLQAKPSSLYNTTNPPEII